MAVTSSGLTAFVLIEIGIEPSFAFVKVLVVLSLTTVETPPLRCLPILK